jgi:hypothetical protein
MQLIDRHALLKNVYDNPPEKARMTYAEWCRKCIYEAPTIEAEPVRRGRWIEETEPDENGNVTAMCNQCYHTDEHCKNIKILYCWYCGARMDATDTNDGGRGGADNDS